MGELTNSLRKKYASLASTKGRREHSLFMAQGEKCVLDTIDYFEIDNVLATSQWIDSHTGIAEANDVTLVTHSDIERISSLSTPPSVIAIYHIPDHTISEFENGLVVALDGVQDPGNLGTIIRVADWMGITEVIASPDTVDVWNPKVVQATMGAISRVKISYIDLTEVLGRTTMPIYGTFLDGDNIYNAPLTKDGIIVMGNEGKGISPEVSSLIRNRLLIPSYPPGRATSESLNVAVATAITLSEFRRRLF